MINIRDEDKARIERTVALLRRQSFLGARQEAIDELTIVLHHIHELSQEQPYRPAQIVR